MYIKERISQSIYSFRVDVDTLYYDTYIPESDSGYIEVDTELFWNRSYILMRDILEELKNSYKRT